MELLFDSSNDRAKLDFENMKNEMAQYINSIALEQGKCHGWNIFGSDVSTRFIVYTYIFERDYIDNTDYNDLYDIEDDFMETWFEICEAESLAEYGWERNRMFYAIFALPENWQDIIKKKYF